MAINIQKYKDIYECYNEKVNLACVCIETNPCIKVSDALEETIIFFNDQVNNLSDWDDSAKDVFVENMKICITNLEKIKESVNTNWQNAEGKYLALKENLSQLKTNYEFLEQTIKNEPKKSSYEKNEFDEMGNIIRTTYLGYEHAIYIWQKRCGQQHLKCEELYSLLVEDKDFLNDINTITLSLQQSSLISIDNLPKIDSQAESNEENQDVNSAAIHSQTQVNVSGYRTAPVSGFGDRGLRFELTTDNEKYDLSDKDLNKLYAIVASEAAHNKDDALGVMSVILNRVESNDNFLGGANPTPISIATADNQFEGYFGGYYKKYLNGNGEYVGDAVIKQAVDDALNGVRNTNATYFLANWCDYYSNNMITPDGNRYKMTWKS